MTTSNKLSSTVVILFVLTNIVSFLIAKDMYHSKRYPEFENAMNVVTQYADDKTSLNTTLYQTRLELERKTQENNLNVESIKDLQETLMAQNKKIKTYQVAIEKEKAVTSTVQKLLVNSRNEELKLQAELAKHKKARVAAEKCLRDFKSTALIPETSFKEFVKRVAHVSS